ncbi:serine/threonine protein phosphatase [Paucibacter aquatile]|uniref:Serine/threonine protein phosphatase n=1 Tax=Kinneretia aquatilis TaxID=2070761 RepID=A0A2N8KRW9_9BURK|nr:MULTISPECIES: PP2C family serine/threonine-protein phosphatase [Roseateles]MCZ8075553.1 serine/threonine-protein phosphatase [Roseateles sp.]OYU26391.1 MAG: serine/threonine protein phosphatase [Burkholderiales bacterium PBB2]PND36183.1 serine/threonine protein phosphatase [Paucibacter aquatile]WIV99585.1 serine/threonine-protein phosphatase [Paucibacter aquatile]
MRFNTFQVSRRGRREKNEDRMGYCYTREAGLFALADGLGGHPEGEVAAQMALQTLAALFQRDAKPALEDPAAFLQDAVLIAHQQLIRYAAEKGMSDTPRTTIVACVLQGRRAFWAHCGDSRLYMVRAGKLIARTRDHSYLELQNALGRVPQDGETFNRNVLLTCLGSPGKPMIDTHGPMLLEVGDRLLLCSDGLWGTVPDDFITEQLSASPVADAVPDLVEQALRNGGPRCDNVTALAVEWEGEADADEGHTEAGISTRSLSDDGFATTIQAAAQDGRGGADELDEAEIERSVREINEAIRRANERQTGVLKKS